MILKFSDEPKALPPETITSAAVSSGLSLSAISSFTKLELLREAGFHPMEVIRAATLHAAEAIGMEDLIGTVEVGKFADLIIMDQNPLKNLKQIGRAHV